MSLFPDDTIVIIENPKKSIRKKNLLGLTGEFSKFAGYKIIVKTSVALQNNRNN